MVEVHLGEGHRQSKGRGNQILYLESGIQNKGQLMRMLLTVSGQDAQNERQMGAFFR